MARRAPPWTVRTEEGREEDGAGGARDLGDPGDRETRDRWNNASSQIALHGNKAAVWEGLIEKKKLPYLAAVRNLRNIVLAGTSEHFIR